MNIEIKGKADPKGEQDFWCKKILTGGRKCGEPFPDHFNGRINDHEFSPLAKSTIKKLKVKAFEIREKEIKERELRIEKIKLHDGIDCDFCNKPASLMVSYNKKIDWSQSCNNHKKDAIESLGEIKI